MDDVRFPIQEAVEQGAGLSFLSNFPIMYDKQGLESKRICPNKGTEDFH